MALRMGKMLEARTTPVKENRTHANWNCNNLLLCLTSWAYFKRTERSTISRVVFNTIRRCKALWHSGDTKCYQDVWEFTLQFGSGTWAICSYTISLLFGLVKNCQRGIYFVVLQHILNTGLIKHDTEFPWRRCVKWHWFVMDFINSCVLHLTEA